jgi:citrate synthase
MDQRLIVTDQRSGASLELPISEGAVQATKLRSLKAGPDDFGVVSYDPGLTNTATCRSAISFVDGEKGVFRYRGYPVDELCESRSFLECAYLVLEGELPSTEQLAEFQSAVSAQMPVHEDLRKIMSGFRKDSRPMTSLISGLSLLGSLYPDARDVADPAVRRKHELRLLAQAATIGAWTYGVFKGGPLNQPNPDLDYTDNLMAMLFAEPGKSYECPAWLKRAMELLLIVHIDHELNCSTNVLRCIASAQGDPYSSAAGAAAALYGPLHGGANEAVLKMLRTIGTPERVPQFVEGVKSGKGGRLMGFGHRVYKSYDPRAKVIRGLVHEVLKQSGKDSPLLQVAMALEEYGVKDDYFLSRKLYPNVDFYSGIAYEAFGLPVEMFTVMFAVPRAIGWMAHWEEQYQDADQKISRPRQVYIGQAERHPVK